MIIILLNIFLLFEKGRNKCSDNVMDRIPMNSSKLSAKFTAQAMPKLPTSNTNTNNSKSEVEMPRSPVSTAEDIVLDITTTSPTQSQPVQSLSQSVAEETTQVVGIQESKILKLLKQIHVNSVMYSTYHNKRFWIYKNVLFLVFRIPLIILSAINTFFAIGMQDNLSQHTISMANALISLGCGIFTSIELFLNLNKKMELELTSHKLFYSLSIDIYKFIEINDFNTQDPTMIRLHIDSFNIMYNRYKELVSNSNAVNVIKLQFHDSLELKPDIQSSAKQPDMHVRDCSSHCCLCCP